MPRSINGSKWSLSALTLGVTVAVAAIALAQTPGAPPVTAEQSGMCPTMPMNVRLGKNLPFEDRGLIECDECLLDIRRHPFATLEGTVFDPAGMPAQGVQLIIESRAQGLAFTSLRTGKNGTYSYTGLPAGEYTVCVAFEGRRGLSRIVPLQEAHQAVSNFDLKYF
ncbi:MAG TPA: carboxypeptidase-like regulatory domain-containing protein [Terriglobia bacterium]|nr:carboxypeptidase-like regulatory domain-containing protein [Terriglobia bacterium]